MLALTALAVGVSGTAIAQNIFGDPGSGTVRLEYGFIPDPYTRNVVSGGTVDASNLGGSCVGYIADDPDVRLKYEALSGGNSLYVSVNSGQDTTLVINAPNGRWYCDDDSGSGTDPMIAFNPAQSGDYEIWIGSYDRGEYHETTLKISELSGG